MGVESSFIVLPVQILRSVARASAGAFRRMANTPENEAYVRGYADALTAVAEAFGIEPQDCAPLEAGR